MKIDVVGSMCTWTKKLSTSYIINDEILFDTPQGTFKTLFEDFYILKTNYIIISHFHSDHFMDIHLVMDYLYHHTKKKITIIAPKGCRERLSSMFKIVDITYLENSFNDMFSIIEIENNKIIKIGDYKIKAFKMLHLNLDSYGFTITHNGVTVGFSGDSAMCNNVRKIISKSKTAFIDCASLEVNNKHLTSDEVYGLIKEFPECKIYPIHMSTFSQPRLDELGIEYPNQADVINVV